jgi:hypothetical protein
MREIVPGLFHWTAHRETIGQPVSSHYYAPEGLLLDPMPPAEGWEWFADQAAGVRHVYLTNRLHSRHVADVVERFGAAVHVHRSGLHHLDVPAEGFEFGDELPGGVLAHGVDAICPDESALHLQPVRAIALADALIGFEQPQFVPDELMGDDPAEVKAGLAEALGRLARLDFDHLLLAHGRPHVGDGPRALRAFLDDR